MIGIRHAAAAAQFVLASILVSTSSEAQPAAQTVNVWSFGFAPRPLHLVAGRPVTLVFVNRSGSSHDFSAPAFFGNASISAGAAPGGEIDLGPHQTKSITLVPRSGIYPARCTHLFHKQLGMSDRIVVQ